MRFSFTVLRLTLPRRFRLGWHYGRGLIDISIRVQGQPILSVGRNRNGQSGSALRQRWVSQQNPFNNVPFEERLKMSKIRR